MTAPTCNGRYIVRAYRRGEQLSDPRAGWDDLADALFLAMDRAEDSATAGRAGDSWIVHDRTTATDIVRVDIGARVHYLA